MLDYRAFRVLFILNSSRFIFCFFEFGKYLVNTIYAMKLLKSQICVTITKMEATVKNTDKLIDLLQNDVIIEIEEYIDDLFEVIADNKHAGDEEKKQLKEVQELRDEFRVMLQDAQAGEIDEDECAEIIAEINEMREGED